MADKIRLDKFLFETGQMPSRSAAQEAIATGKVLVNGKVVSKASEKVSAEDVIEAEQAHPYVSRAALKLKAGLEAFPVLVARKTCLDVGSSTGGFTEVLLEAGAGHVTAVDVGRDQFHERLRGHEKITLFEQKDARRLSQDMFSMPPELIVCDASFIGLEKLLWPALSLAAEAADLIALFKPQFQVGKKNIGKGGIVTDQDAVGIARSEFEAWLVSVGWQPRDWRPSPVTGSDGNQEYLVWATRDRSP